MTSTEKVLCPWCGAEMEINTIELNRGHIARMECHNSECNARGPMTKWHDTEEKAIESARAAALRRYTPQIKPMTLEEVLWTEGEIYVDYAGEFDTWACRCFINSTTEEVTVHCIEETETLDFSAYNRTWRCWSRKPTDEERSAAEWEK